jgi:hypothetical protein
VPRSHSPVTGWERTKVLGSVYSDTSTRGTHLNTLEKYHIYTKSVKTNYTRITYIDIFETLQELNTREQYTHLI